MFSTKSTTGITLAVVWWPGAKSASARPKAPRLSQPDSACERFKRFPHDQPQSSNSHPGATACATMQAVEGSRRNETPSTQP